MPEELTEDDDGNRHGLSRLDPSRIAEIDAITYQIQAESAAGAIRTFWKGTRGVPRKLRRMVTLMYANALLSEGGEWEEWEPPENDEEVDA